MRKKRHQCCIDLSKNTLRINNTEVSFLAEHELPEKARRLGEPEEAVEPGAASGSGKQSSGGSSTNTGPSKTEFPGSGQPLGAMPAGAAPPTGTTPAATNQFPEAHIESVSLVELSRDLD
jgi:DNA damage-inducible protein 1